jgi:hypothetical protein
VTVALHFLVHHSCINHLRETIDFCEPEYEMAA